MITRRLPSESIAVQNWRELYLAALFETDREKLSSRIEHAERAMISRARDIFAIAGSNSEEGKALDKGLYAMRALRNCLELKTA